MRKIIALLCLLCAFCPYSASTDTKDILAGLEKIGKIVVSKEYLTLKKHYISITDGKKISGIAVPESELPGFKFVANTYSYSLVNEDGNFDSEGAIYQDNTPRRVLLLKTSQDVDAPESMDEISLTFKHHTSIQVKGTKVHAVTTIKEIGRKCLNYILVFLDEYELDELIGDKFTVVKSLDGKIAYNIVEDSEPIDEEREVVSPSEPIILAEEMKICNEENLQGSETKKDDFQEPKHDDGRMKGSDVEDREIDDGDNYIPEESITKLKQLHGALGLSIKRTFYLFPKGN